MNGYIRFILRHRRMVLALIILSIGLSAYAARRIRIRFDNRDFYYYSGNPDLPVIDRYHATFADPGGFIAVLVEAPDVLAPEVLRYVDQVTRALEPQASFSRVRSLVNARIPRAEGDAVEIGPLIAELPVKDPEALRKLATSSRLLSHRLIAPDRTATVIAAQLRGSELEMTYDLKVAAIAAVRRTVDAVAPPAGTRVRITGAPVLDVEGANALVKNQRRFTPLSCLLILIALIVTFRSVQGVLLPLAAVVTAIVWTAGIFSFFGRPVDYLTTTVPATLMVYGGVDPIFVLTRFLSKVKEGRPRDEAIVESFGELALPCFLTSLTTALGFLGFATLTLQMVVTYGIVVAIGVICAFITTMTVLPVLLAVLPMKKDAVDREAKAQKLERRFSRLWAVLNPRRRVIVGGAVVLALVGMTIAVRQHVSVYYTRVLPPGEALDAVRVLERKLTGVARMSVLLEGAPGQMRRPEVVQAIARVDAAAERDKLVTTALSLADLVAENNQAFQGGGAEHRQVPSSEKLIAQYLAMQDPNERGDFVTDDYRATHIRVFFIDEGSEPFRPMRDAVFALAKKELEPLGITVSMTGKTYTAYKALDTLSMEMVLGHLFGFSIIVLLELLILRSFRVALISILPNLLPAIACFSVLSLAGITLRLGTVLFLGVSLGGLFNTTIQFAARIQQRIREGARDPDEVMDHAMRVVGPPSMFTAVILSLGFAIFMLGSTPDIRVFGLLSMTILLGGLVSDLVLTTTMMRLFFGWKRAFKEADKHASPGGSGSSAHIDDGRGADAAER
jgi:uncharacterized protein